MTIWAVLFHCFLKLMIIEVIFGRLVSVVFERCLFTGVARTPGDEDSVRRGHRVFGTSEDH